MSASWRVDATELLERYSSRQVDPETIVAISMERIDRLDRQINAVVAVSRSAKAEAQASAARWRAGTPMGALDGIPILVKDNLNVAGMPATFGSAMYRDHVPRVDELPLLRLRAAGAIIIGKTNCPEFALEGYTANALHGVTVNPFDTRLTPGGSSGGAVAAVAMGYAPISIGTDGGGSLRRPAAYTGLFGLKPTSGQVARDEGLPQLLLDFEVVGPFARTVRDLKLVYEVIAKPARIDPSSRRRVNARSVGGPLTILYAPGISDSPCDPEIYSACSLAAAHFAALGHDVREGVLPFDTKAINAEWPIIGQIALANLRTQNANFDTKASNKYRDMADAGEAIPAHRLYALLDRFSALRRAVSETFATIDAILTPSCAAMPWAAGQAFPETIDGRKAGPRGHAIYTSWVNAAGHPAIAVPAGRLPARMPIGFQLIGDLGTERMLFDLAQQYERSRLEYFVWPHLAG